MLLIVKTALPEITGSSIERLYRTSATPGVSHFQRCAVKLRSGRGRLSEGRQTADFARVISFSRMARVMPSKYYEQSCMKVASNPSFHTRLIA